MLPGCTERMVKPFSSSSINTPPGSPALVQTPPHSTVLLHASRMPDHSLHKRVSSHDCSVGRTSANDDVCAVFECFFVGFRTQKCYDGAALIKGFFGDFRCTVEGRNFAFTIFFLDDFRVLLGVNAGNLFVDAGLFADFPDQLQGSVDAFIGTQVPQSRWS